MKIRRTQLYLSLASLPLVVSCNIYAPLTSTSTDTDKVEEAQKCLHENDFACAVEAYSELSDGTLKNEKLCAVYISAMGITLNTLLNTINKNSGQMMGSFATALIPWTQEKQVASDNAKDWCDKYAQAAAGQELPVLLHTVSLLGHCAIRMAKTDQYVATSNDDTSCSTPGDGNGRITQSDISDNSNGAITSKGMCKADVTACQQDVTSVNSSSLGGSGLSELIAAYNALPAALKTANALTDVVRGGIRSLVSQ